MKIAFFEVPEEKQIIFKTAFLGAEVSFYKENLTQENLSRVKDADVTSVFTDSLVGKDVIDLLPNLKLIATTSTGFDHIDIDHARSKGIKVCNVPSYGADTVAEFTFALILTLSRKMREASRSLKETGDYSIPEKLQGFDLAGKTLGIVGTGKIGKNVARIGRAFKMNVLGCDLSPDLEFAKENDFTYKSFLEVLAESDIVTLHAPYTKENHHLINKENISLFKKGAYLINTARGDLVDTDALMYGLSEGWIAGAGLDVLEGERNFKKGDIIPMLEMPNVVMTPHTAFNTKEAEDRIVATTIENISAFFAGTPQNVVNK